MSNFTEVVEIEDATREEQELTVLGMMIEEPENYELAKARLTEKDFVHYGEFFRAILETYKRTNNVNFNALGDVCEEWGITDLVNISRMMGLADAYDMQFLINLLKAREDTTPISICRKENMGGHTYISQEDGGGVTHLASSVMPSVMPSVMLRDADTPSVTAELPLPEKIKEWIKDTVGWFTYKQIDEEIGIQTDNDKARRRWVVKRMCDNGEVERHPKKEGEYRYVNTEAEALNYKKGAYQSLDLKFPFELENYVKIYPGNTIVVAGSPNAGKTAFLLNFIKMNQDKFPTYYWCSEMGEEELGDRLRNFSDIAIEDWSFIAKERTDNFTDVIVPDCINIIDYLEMSTDLWLIRDHLAAIQRKIGKGVAVIAIQKKKGAELGRGAEFGTEKPKLYVTMDNGVFRIEKAKTWKNKGVNPNGMVSSFKLINGCDFINEPLHKDGDKTFQIGLM